MTQYKNKSPLTERFSGLLPVVIDVETGGVNAETDALLEIAAVLLDIDENGQLVKGETHACHVTPFEGSKLHEKALEITGIDPYHPFRFAVDEAEALEQIFEPVRQFIKQHRAVRAVLVGHNPCFDLAFMHAAMKRCKIKKSPFHAFTTFDTATLGGVAYGKTVLAKATRAAGIHFDPKEAHSAIYDAEKTAELFCLICNKFPSPINGRRE